MPNITTRLLASTQAKSTPYFIRDDRFKGFAVKVNSTGAIKFIAETWHQGKSVRRTLGDYPVVPIQEARQQALAFIQQVRLGQLTPKQQP